MNHDALRWYESLNDDVEFKCEDNKNDFAILLNTLMMQKDISKTELAKRYGKKLSYISRVLRGDENLTITSMTKLLDAIGCNLHICACENGEEHKTPTVFSVGRIAQFNKDQNKETAAIQWASKRGRESHEAA